MSDAAQQPLPAASRTMSADLTQLSVRGKQSEYRKGTLLIQEGDEGDSMFIIVSGRVKVFAMDSIDHEVTYGIYGAGDIFGEMSLDGGPRSASVITLETTVCAVVSKRTLREFMTERPDFAFSLLTTIIQRARQSTRIARALALDDVYSRLSRYLTAQAVPRADGTQVMQERLTHQELASRVGASREMVSRILKDLELGGHLSVQEHRLVLLSKLPERW